MQFYQATRIINDRISLTGYCGLSADSLETAEKRLEKELKKGGRTLYYKEWHASGRPIIVSMGPGLAPYDLKFMYVPEADRLDKLWVT